MSQDAPKIARWFFVPPLIALLALLLVQTSGSERQLFLRLNRLGQFGGDTLWIYLSTLGEGVVVCVIMLPLIRRRPVFVWSMVLSLLLGVLWIHSLKYLSHQLRPASVLPSTDFHSIGETYQFNSFPSGHAATAASFAANFCLFFRQKLARAAVIGLALLISFSRIAVGLHWPTDVLVGFASGWLLALLSYRLALRFRFGVTSVAQVIFGLEFFGAALWIMFVNYTGSDHQAFRFRQVIALTCLVLTFGGFVSQRIRGAAVRP